MSLTSHLADQIRSALTARGLSVRAAERQAGMPQRSIQAVLDGHMPHLDRAAAIAAALGYKLVIQPVRSGPRPIPDAHSAAPGAASGAGGKRSTSPADVAGVPVEDRRLAEMLAVLADEFEALNERGQESLCTRFWHAHPDLRERALARQGRRLARLAGDSGAGEPSRRGGGLTAAPTPSQRG